MKKFAVVAALLAAGCGNPHQSEPTELLAECFSEAAYACVVAESIVTAPEREPSPCCGKCNGTGKVLSGDRLALVDCDCDPSCKCKSRKSCKPGGECRE